MKNIVLFGPPGAGKGTQANILKQKYNLIHISTGDIFRRNIKNKTALGLMAEEYINAGDLVPDKLTISMLKEEVNKNAGVNGFIFDGFPRTESQAKALSIFLAEKGEKINGMVALEVSETLLTKRILERGKTSLRTDDTDEEKIKNRFNEYYIKTAVLKNFYQKQGKYYEVDGTGSIDEVTKQLSDIFDKL
ncbi:MAG: adenylate kinase [Tenacibaculum sp.]